MSNATTSARSEYREEECEECGWTRDRVWRVATIGKGVTVPAGWRIEKRSTSGQWRRIAAPIRDVTLCGCDVP